MCCNVMKYNLEIESHFAGGKHMNIINCISHFGTQYVGREMSPVILDASALQTFDLVKLSCTIPSKSFFIHSFPLLSLIVSFQY